MSNEDKAKRDPIDIRMDLIPAKCLLEVAKVFGLGAKRYGDLNWQKSRMEGDKSPINHALVHINNYIAGIKDDDGDDLKIHLTHAIVNLMFEFWWEEKEQEETPIEHLAKVLDSARKEKKAVKEEPKKKILMFLTMGLEKDTRCSHCTVLHPKGIRATVIHTRPQIFCNEKCAADWWDYTFAGSAQKKAFEREVLPVWDDEEKKKAKRRLQIFSDPEKKKGSLPQLETKHYSNTNICTNCQKSHTNTYLTMFKGNQPHGIFCDAICATRWWEDRKKEQQEKIWESPSTENFAERVLRLTGEPKKEENKHLKEEEEPHKHFYVNLKGIVGISSKEYLRIAKSYSNIEIFIYPSATYYCSVPSRAYVEECRNMSKNHYEANF